MQENTCVNCATPLPVSFSDDVLACSSCGTENHIEKESKDVLANIYATKTKTPPKKLTLLQKLGRAGNILLGLLLIAYLIYKVAGYFGFEITPTFYTVEKITIKQTDLKDFSEVGINNLLVGFYEELGNRRWLGSIASRTRLKKEQVQACLNVHYYLDNNEQQENTWLIEISCELDAKNLSNSRLVASELKAKLETYIKKITPR